VTVADQVLQLTQVKAQPANDRFGNLKLTGGLSRFVVAVTHVPG
jgi:hypothetical protein